MPPWERYPRSWPEQGYVVLAMSMRGWGAGKDDCGLRQPVDTATAVQWLASQRGVDPDRIGLVGFSRGGQVALLTGATSPSIKAIVAYYAPTDWKRYRDHWSTFDLIGSRLFYQACYPDSEGRSPVAVADKIKAPVLLVQGDSDTNVSPEQADEMAEAIRKSGGNVETYFVSGAGHGFSPILTDAWPATLEFLAAKLHRTGCLN